MRSKISALGVKKITLALVFGFILFGGNVFAGDTRIIDGEKVYTDSTGEEHIVTNDQQVRAIEASKEETGKATDGVTVNVNSPIESTDMPKDGITPGGNSPDLEDYTTRQQKRSTSNSSSSSSEGIQVNVTEKIPGADCDGSDGDYTCTVQPGFKTVMGLMGGIIKYFTYLAALGGVLFIVINGMMLSMGGMGGNKDEIKKKITMTIGGLILLLLSGLILNAIAPWIYK